MASQHGYFTVAELEAVRGIDYSARNSLYTDTMIEGQITLTEELLIVAEGITRTGTIPTDVKYIGMEIAATFMTNKMIEDGLMEGDIRSLDSIRRFLKETFASASDSYSDRRSIFVKKG